MNSWTSISIGGLVTGGLMSLVLA